MRDPSLRLDLEDKLHANIPGTLGSQLQNKQFHRYKIKRFLPHPLIDIYLTRLSVNYSVMQEFKNW
jgi:hypothetical protein